MPVVFKVGNNSAQPNPPRGPGIVRQAISYAQSMAAWVAAGRPTRDAQERSRIYNDVCVPCENFQGKMRGGRCKLCGCSLNINGQKIAWATEQCPANPPKWLAVKNQNQEGEKMANESKEDLAEEPGPAVAVSDKVVSIHPEHNPKDPLVAYDRHGYMTDSLRDIWRGSAGFLVCGGPSLKQLPIERLAERGIVSLGINNVSGYAPVRAATWSDPTEKFHHGISLDPSIIKFVPQERLGDAVAIKLPDGKFAWTDMTLADCPNVWGFKRNCDWEPSTFLTRDSASWGNNDAGVVMNGRPKIIFTFFLGLRLLHYLGCRRIYLLGVDFSMSGQEGGGYAFNERRDGGAAKCNNDHYKRAAGMLAELKPILDAAKFEIFNCNQKSALEVFPFCPFAEALEDCRGNIQPGPFDLNGWYAKSLTNHGGKDAGRAAAKAARQVAEQMRRGPNPHGKREQKKIQARGPAFAQREAEAREKAQEIAASKPLTRKERRERRAARIAARQARAALRGNVAGQ